MMPCFYALHITFIIVGSDASLEKEAALQEWTWGKEGSFDPSEFLHLMGEVCNYV